MEERSGESLRESISRERSLQSKENRLREQELELLNFQNQMKESYEEFMKWRETCVSLLSESSLSFPDPPKQLISLNLCSEKDSNPPSPQMTPADEELMLLVEESAKLRHDTILSPKNLHTNINSNKAIPRLIEPLSVAPISKKRQKTLKLSHENPSDPSVCESRHKKFGSFQGEISPKISKVEKDESIEKDEESKEDDMV